MTAKPARKFKPQTKPKSLFKYKGLGLSKDEREFIIDGQALSMYIHTLVDGSPEQEHAIMQLVKFQSDNRVLTDTINNKIKILIGEKNESDETPKVN